MKGLFVGTDGRSAVAIVAEKITEMIDAQWVAKKSGTTLKPDT